MLDYDKLEKMITYGKLDKSEPIKNSIGYIQIRLTFIYEDCKLELFLCDDEGVLNFTNDDFDLRVSTYKAGFPDCFLNRVKEMVGYEKIVSKHNLRGE